MKVITQQEPEHELPASVQQAHKECIFRALQVAQSAERRRQLRLVAAANQGKSSLLKLERRYASERALDEVRIKHLAYDLEVVESHYKKNGYHRAKSMSDAENSVVRQSPRQGRKDDGHIVMDPNRILFLQQMYNTLEGPPVPIKRIAANEQARTQREALERLRKPVRARDFIRDPADSAVGNIHAPTSRRLELLMEKREVLAQLKRVVDKEKALAEHGSMSWHSSRNNSWRSSSVGLSTSRSCASDIGSVRSSATSEASYATYRTGRISTKWGKPTRQLPALPRLRLVPER